MGMNIKKEPALHRRPKACREYPHTDRKKMVQIMDLTYKNSLVCPAVLEMLKRIQEKV